MINVTKFCKKDCCPVVEYDSENQIVELGDREGIEGTTIWSVEQFKDFLDAAKEGKFDHIVKNTKEK